MKKPLLLGLVISLALGITACSSGNEEKKDGTKENHQNEQVLENKSNKEEQAIYGKVKSIVGNEIEFELAKSPDKDIAGIEKEEKEPTEEEIKGSVPATMSTPANSIEDGKKVSVEDIEKNEPLVDLEFTGELKTIIIPTGVDINILSARSGEGLSAIKEGTYLKLSVDDNKSENPTVLSIDVIS